MEAFRAGDSDFVLSFLASMSFIYTCAAAVLRVLEKKTEKQKRKIKRQQTVAAALKACRVVLFLHIFFSPLSLFFISLFSLPSPSTLFTASP